MRQLPSGVGAIKGSPVLTPTLLGKHYLLVAGNSGVANDTVALINKAINKYSQGEFIKYCVKVIDSISKNDFEFCKNLFEIVAPGDNRA